MKNIYELSTKEKDKYRDEFNKLEYTKKINFIRTPSLFVFLLSIFIAGFLTGIEDGSELENWINLFDTIFAITIFIFIILTINLDISFRRWLKIKHNIEY